MLKNIKVETCEMHTGGEPLRIVTAGYPDIKGETVLDKRRYCKENLDYFRRLLMHEPRGHFDQYGALIVPADKGTDAELGVLFLHNEGYSVMCGHAMMALGRYAIDHGFVDKSKLQSPETIFAIQCPCGVVKVHVEYENGITGRVRFHSVAAFVYELDVVVEVEGYGPITVDIVFGGTFYAILSADKVGLDVNKSRASDLANAADKITQVLRKSYKLQHPVSADLAFMYGTILTDGGCGKDGKPSVNICVFAEKAVDRCPTGSGVTARMALHYHRKLITKDDVCTFQGVGGSQFRGRIYNETTCGSHNAVTVEISGKAHYSGTSVFTVEEDDPLAPGFLLH